MAPGELGDDIKDIFWTCMRATVNTTGWEFHQDLATLSLQAETNDKKSELRSVLDTVE